LLNGAVPRDLETICLKCLEKEPHRRYATALELVEELGGFCEMNRFGCDRRARLKKAWRWCRRNRAQASAIGLLLALAVIVGTGSPIAAYRSIASGNGPRATPFWRQSTLARRERHPAEPAKIVRGADKFGATGFEEGDVARVEEC